MNEPNIITSFRTDNITSTPSEIKRWCDDYFHQENINTIINLLDNEENASGIFEIGEDAECNLFLRTKEDGDWQKINLVE